MFFAVQGAGTLGEEVVEPFFLWGEGVCVEALNGPVGLA
jgi:hypothetical protein